MCTGWVVPASGIYWLPSGKIVQLTDLARKRLRIYMICNKLAFGLYYLDFLDSCGFIMDKKMFYIREFKIGDEIEIYQLFYDTVHQVNIKDYTKEQVEIWAPKTPDLNKWRTSLSENYTFVAIDKQNGKIIGFSDLAKNGYLNRGYVHKDYQRQGIGKELLKAREDKAKELGIKKLFSDVSISAKHFFQKYGYTVEKEQTKNINGVLFTNYLMTKEL